MLRWRSKYFYEAKCGRSSLESGRENPEGNPRNSKVGASRWNKVLGGLRALNQVGALLAVAAKKNFAACSFLGKEEAYLFEYRFLIE